MVSDTAHSVEFRSISKHYGAVAALHALDLKIEAGEFVALLGPSGSGKTTLLSIAAGFITPGSGHVLIGDREVTGLAPRRRNIGMVFQNYALFPHMSVFDNVAYGLRVRRLPAAQIRARVNEALAMVQLEPYAQRRIGALSGGQQQRVALARATVIAPSLLLMDEPLGALDRNLRKQVQLEIRRLHRRIGATTIYVTHDQEEAMVLADRVGVMRAGRIEQIGAPHELYLRPASTFVARFLGESNILQGTLLKREGGRGCLEVESLGLRFDGLCVGRAGEGAPAAVLIRPENVRPDPEGPLTGRVAEVIYMGEVNATRLGLPDGQEFWCRAFSHDRPPREGDEVRLSWRPEDVIILDLETS